MKIAKTYYTLCSLMLAMFVACSCVQTVDMPSALENPPIVVKCVLTWSGQQKVTLCYAGGVSGGDMAMVKEAEVAIGEAGLILKNGVKLKDGEWEVKIFPDFGKTYELTVKVEGYKEIKAFTRFPDGVTFFSKWNYKHTMEYQDFDDICVTDRYYLENYHIWQYDFYDKDLRLWMRHSDWIPVTTDHKNAEYINDGLIHMFHPAGYGSFKFDIGIDCYDHFHGHRHSLIIYSVSEELDRYMVEALKMRQPTDIVSLMFSNATNIYSNVQNGMGVFGAADCVCLRFPLEPSTEGFLVMTTPYEFERIAADL